MTVGVSLKGYVSQRSEFDLMEHNKADQGKTLNVVYEDKLCLHMFWYFSVLLHYFLSSALLFLLCSLQGKINICLCLSSFPLNTCVLCENRRSADIEMGCECG